MTRPAVFDPQLAAWATAMTAAAPAPWIARPDGTSGLWAVYDADGDPVVWYYGSGDHDRAAAEATVALVNSLAGGGWWTGPTAIDIDPPERADDPSTWTAGDGEPWRRPLPDGGGCIISFAIMLPVLAALALWILR